MRRRAALLGVLVLVGCSSSPSAQGGSPADGGGGASEGGARGQGGAASDGGGGAFGGPEDPIECLAQTTQADCEAIGCLYWGATLFEELTCGEGIPVEVCIWATPNAGFQSPSAWKRDTAHGRVVLGFGVIPAVAPAGYDLCAESFEDFPCECLQ